jgi:hypothetical protein
MGRVGVMVFNATYFSYIVAVSYLGGWVEETGVPGENHRPTTSNWQTKIYIPYVMHQLFDQTTIVIAAILQASGSPWCIALVSAATQRCSEDPQQAR